MIFPCLAITSFSCGSPVCVLDAIWSASSSEDGEKCVSPSDTGSLSPLPFGEPSFRESTTGVAAGGSGLGDPAGGSVARFKAGRTAGRTAGGTTAWTTGETTGGTTAWTTGGTAADCEAGSSLWTVVLSFVILCTRAFNLSTAGQPTLLTRVNVTSYEVVRNVHKTVNGM